MGRLQPISCMGPENAAWVVCNYAETGILPAGKGLRFLKSLCHLAENVCETCALRRPLNSDPHWQFLLDCANAINLIALSLITYN